MTQKERLARFINTEDFVFDSNTFYGLVMPELHKRGWWSIITCGIDNLVSIGNETRVIIVTASELDITSGNIEPVMFEALNRVLVILENEDNAEKKLPISF